MALEVNRPPIMSPTRERKLGVAGTAAVAIVLSAVAGFVDIVGWLAVAHVYSANMTGNTLHFAQGIARGHAAEAFARAWPILCFVVGLFASEVVHLITRQRGGSSSASFTLGLEALFIALVVIVLPLPPDSEIATAAGWRYFVPVGLLSTAMGLQNASLVRVGASSVYTTHVTGNLTRLAREAAHWGVSLWHRPERANGVRSGRRALLMAAVWTAYLFGSLLGVLGRGGFGLRSLVFPLIVLVGLVALDRVRPFCGHDFPNETHPMF